MTDTILEGDARDDERGLDDLSWLGGDSQPALEWQEAQRRAAWKRLSELGDRDAAIEHFSATIPRVRVFPPRRAGSVWFRQEYRGAEGRAVLIAARGPDQPGTIVADADAGDQISRSLDYYFPSPDGSHVAVGWSRRGTERSTIEIVEIATGAVLPFRAPQARMAVVSWLGDGSGFYYDALSDAGTRRLFLYRLGEKAPVEQAFAYRTGLVRARVSPDGQRVVVFCGYPNLVPVAWNDAGSFEPWRTLLPTSDGAFSGDLHGTELVTLTTEGAPNGRVVSIPLETAPDRSTWRELIPESSVVIDTVSVVSDRIVVGGLCTAAAEISSYHLDGRPAETIKLPPRSAISVRPIELSGVDPMFFSTAEDLFFLQHGLVQPPAGYHYHVPSRSLTRIAPPGRNHPGLKVRAGTAASPDGTRVPYEVIERTDRAGPVPAMLHAYAGPYGLMPGYNWDLIEFVEAGGVVAIAHCRGGTEYGPAWKDAAFGPEGTLRKMDDLYVVAQALTDDGIAAKERIGFTGGSAGGIVAGIALTQRPGLFAAVCPQYALFDYAAIMPFLVPRATLSDDQYDREVAKVMSFSPLQSIRAQTRYPATLIQMGAEDAMTPLQSSRQITARLQAVDSATDHLLFVYSEVGHATAPTVRHLAELAADWLIFSKGILLR